MSFTKLLPQSPSAGGTRKKRKLIPKSYQLKAVEFGISRPAAGFFLAPGLGKTLITLLIFKLLRDAGYVDTLFVIAKRRIVQEVWGQEVDKWKFGWRHEILHGPKKSNVLANSGATCFFMNYEGLQWLVPRKGRGRALSDDAKRLFKGRRVMLVVDESSQMRNTRAQRFKCLRQLLPMFARRYILTGSPAPRSLENLFGQVMILDLGKALGTFITHFRNEYFVPTGYMGFDWKPAPGAEKRIRKRLRNLIIRFGKEELELPPIKWVDIPVRLPPKAMRRYREMEEEFITKIENGEITAANAAVASGKCRQLANGGIFTGPKERGKPRPYVAVHDAKNEALVDLLEELQGEPALVACDFKHDVPRFNAYAKKHAPQFVGAPVADGSTSDKELRAIRKKWDAGALPLLWGNPQSVAHGLNMQGKGGIVVYYSLTWNLEDYEQFYQRVWRQGQDRRVLVYRILARDTVDYVMTQSLKRKDKGQQRLLRAMERHYGIQQD